MQAFSIKVTGRVQGVFFRASTRDKARALDIKGWCQNEPDGSVLIHIEGPQALLEEMIAWCHKGPQFARVDKLESAAVAVEGFQDFEIRR